MPLGYNLENYKDPWGQARPNAYAIVAPQSGYRRSPGPNSTTWDVIPMAIYSQESDGAAGIPPLQTVNVQVKAGTALQVPPGAPTPTLTDGALNYALTVMAYSAYVTTPTTDPNYAALQVFAGASLVTT